MNERMSSNVISGIFWNRTKSRPDGAEPEPQQGALGSAGALEVKVHLFSSCLLLASERSQVT